MKASPWEKEDAMSEGIPIINNRPPKEFVHENGRLKRRGSYRDGEEDGPFEIYYPSGVLKRKGFFRQGKLDGESESYDENGRLIDKTLYKNGQQVS